jgi:hypothetical protein
MPFCHLFRWTTGYSASRRLRRSAAAIKQQRLTREDFQSVHRAVADLGLTLAEGRALLAEVQSLLVSEHTAGWMESQLACNRCGSMLPHKDAQSIVLRTVFGKVDVPSLRLWACNCAAKQGQPRRSVSSLCKAVHQRVTPELEYLQAKWAAHLPYRQATELLREVLR